MKISGKKGYYRRQDADIKMSKDEKEFIIKGSWHRIYAEVALEGDDVYIPVVVQGTELDMRKYLGFVSEKRARAIVSGLHLWRFKDLTLEAKNCRMVDLPGQRVSFMRMTPDKEVTTKDGKQFTKPGVPVQHLGRIGFDVRQVYIPIITKDGSRTKIRFDNFVFQEKSKGDK